MENLPSIALSIRQPWAWLVANGYKTTENRSRPTSFRGPILIHASKAFTGEAWDQARELAMRCGSVMPPLSECHLGGIVGVAEIVDCKLVSYDPWHTPGHFGWKLANARPLPIMPFRGLLGFFPCVYQNDQPPL